ncbi:hypothetical protein D1007_21707 [Hordeum vulgare]|nr:hypothetical protein D1007_21707 [Hordeum vulgare]
MPTSVAAGHPGWRSRSPPHGYVYLNCGWQMFARTRGLKGRRYLDFKFDGEATLFGKIFGGERMGCYPKDASRGDPVDGPASGGVRRNSAGSPTGSSDTSYNEPPRRRARTMWESPQARRRPSAPVKEEEGTD